MLKKKYFTYRWLVLVAIFASLIFSGCGGDETDEVATEVPQEAETDTPEVEAETVEDEPTDEPTTEEPETPSEEPSGDPPEGPEPEPDDPPTNGEIPESLCLSPVTEAGDITTPESKSGNTNPGGGDDHGIEGGGDGSIAGGSTENLVMVFTSRQITLPLTITDSLSDTEIFIAQSQFGSAIPLTDNSWADMDPNLSQDLKYITFASDGGNGNIDIYFAELVKIDGRVIGMEDPIRITDDPEPDRYPALSNDNTEVVFSSCRNGNHDIFSKGVEDDVTGNLTSLTQLTDHPADDLYPTLSPDGSWLAFASFRHGNTSEIYRVEVDDTSNIVRLTTNTVNDGHPDYCWKVNKLAFDSQRDGNWGIYIMDSGHFEEQVQLVSKSESIYRDIYPIWSSNGRSISFLSNRLNVISSPDGLKPFWVYVNGCVSEEPKGWLSTP